MATTLGPAVIRVKIVPDSTPSATPTAGGAAAAAPSAGEMRQEEHKTEEAVRRVTRREPGAAGGDEGIGVKDVAKVALTAIIAAKLAAQVVPVVTALLKGMIPGMVTDEINRNAQQLADAATTALTLLAPTFQAGATSIEMQRARASLGLPLAGPGQEFDEFRTEARINIAVAKLQKNIDRDMNVNAAEAVGAGIHKAVSDAVKASLGR